MQIPPGCNYTVGSCVHCGAHIRLDAPAGSPISPCADPRLYLIPAERYELTRLESRAGLLWSAFIICLCFALIPAVIPLVFIVINRRTRRNMMAQATARMIRGDSPFALTLDESEAIATNQRGKRRIKLILVTLLILILMGEIFYVVKSRIDESFRAEYSEAVNYMFGADFNDSSPR